MLAKTFLKHTLCRFSTGATSGSTAQASSPVHMSCQRHTLCGFLTGVSIWIHSTSFLTCFCQRHTLCAFSTGATSGSTAQASSPVHMSCQRHTLCGFLTGVSIWIHSTSFLTCSYELSETYPLWILNWGQHLDPQHKLPHLFI